MRRSRSRFTASVTITGSFTNDRDDLFAGHTALPLGNPFEHLGHRRARGNLFELDQEVGGQRTSAFGSADAEQAVDSLRDLTDLDRTCHLHILHPLCM
jgi:hypothetical protein